MGLCIGPVRPEVPAGARAWARLTPCLPAPPADVLPILLPQDWLLRGCGQHGPWRGSSQLQLLMSLRGSPTASCPCSPGGGRMGVKADPHGVSHHRAVLVERVVSL